VFQYGMHTRFGTRPHASNGAPPSMKIRSIGEAGQSVLQAFRGKRLLGGCDPCEDTDPADQTDPRRLKVPPFVAPGNGKDAWQCL
jgi:hypothetical protein